MNHECFLQLAAPCAIFRKQELANHREPAAAKQPSAGSQRLIIGCRWPRWDGECVPADSSHPSGPRRAHEGSQPRLCPRGGKKPGCQGVQGRQAVREPAGCLLPSFPKATGAGLQAAEFRFDESWVSPLQKAWGEGASCKFLIII